MGKKLKRDNKNRDVSGDEKDKKLLLYSAVIFFLVLIMFFWIFNLSSILSSKTIEEEEVDNFNWNKISDTLKNTWSNFSDNWNEASVELENKAENNPDIFVSSTSTEDVSTSTVDVEEFEDMQSELKKLEEALEEAQIEKQNPNNCPEWVNCMPTYGDSGPRNCVIPPGCEGITEKVY
ncbi:hypothetical protein K9M50_00135 [Patescibacteria group bacterium]|nr:hypothetical protein [Patescibacteria group bacterium]